MVLDASAVVELLLVTPAGRRVAGRIADPDVALHAPHLLGVEVAQVLRRLVAAGTMTERRAGAALDHLLGLDLERHDHEALLPRSWQLRANVTMYDAVYLALAEGLDAPLLTLDARLGRAPGHRAVVEVLAN